MTTIRDASLGIKLEGLSETLRGIGQVKKEIDTVPKEINIKVATDNLKVGSNRWKDLTKDQAKYDESLNDIFKKETKGINEVIKALDGVNLLFGKQVINTGRINQLSKAFGPLVDGIEGAIKSTTGLDVGLGTIGVVGAAAMVAVGLGVLAVTNYLDDAIKSAVAFEDQLNEMQRSMGATANQMNAMSAFSLGLSLKTGTSQADLMKMGREAYEAGAGQYGGQSGIVNDKIIGSLVETANTLPASFGKGTTGADFIPLLADYEISLKKQGQSSEEFYAKMADTFAVTQQEFHVVPSDLKYILGSLSNKLTTLGGEVDLNVNAANDMVGVYGSMIPQLTKLSYRSKMSSVMLAQSIVEPILSTETAKQSSISQAFGFTSLEEYKQRQSDPAALVMEILKRYAAAKGNLGMQQSMRASMGQELAGALDVVGDPTKAKYTEEELKRWTELLDPLNKANAEGSLRIRNFAEEQASLSGQLGDLQNRFVQLSLSIGELFLPGLVALATWANNLTSALDPLIVKMEAWGKTAEGIMAIKLFSAIGIALLVAGLILVAGALAGVAAGALAAVGGVGAVATALGVGGVVALGTVAIASGGTGSTAASVKGTQQLSLMGDLLKGISDTLTALFEFLKSIGDWALALLGRASPAEIKKAEAKIPNTLVDLMNTEPFSQSDLDKFAGDVLKWLWGPFTKGGSFEPDFWYIPNLAFQALTDTIGLLSDAIMKFIGWLGSLSWLPGHEVFALDAANYEKGKGTAFMNSVQTLGSATVTQENTEGGSAGSTGPYEGGSAGSTGPYIPSGSTNNEPPADFVPLTADQTEAEKIAFAKKSGAAAKKVKETYESRMKTLMSGGTMDQATADQLTRAAGFFPTTSGASISGTSGKDSIQASTYAKNRAKYGLASGDTRTDYGLALLHPNEAVIPANLNPAMTGNFEGLSKFFGIPGFAEGAKNIGSYAGAGTTDESGRNRVSQDTLNNRGNYKIPSVEELSKMLTDMYVSADPSGTPYWESRATSGHASLIGQVEQVRDAMVVLGVLELGTSIMDPPGIESLCERAGKGILDEQAKKLFKQVATDTLVKSHTTQLKPSDLSELLLVPSHATGINYVPRTGLALLHQGEAVVPASQNNGSNSKQYTLNVSVPVTINSNGDNIDSFALRRTIENIVQDAVRHTMS
jgi:hypothetical protein